LKDRYWRRFEAEDLEIRRSNLQGRDRERAELKYQWKQYRQMKEKEFAEQKEMRRQLRGGYSSDEEDESNTETIEEIVEEEISREEEVC